MEVQVNLIGVLAAVVAAMVIGSIWYSKAVFGRQWRKLEDIDEKKAKADMPRGMAGMVVISFLIAYVLAHVTYISDYFYGDYSYQSAALTTAFWMWLGFVLPVVAGNSLFNQRPWKATAIHAGNWLVTMLSMGLVIGAIGV
jgi:hypothetical protein